jgi:hypothetical protein
LKMRHKPEPAQSIPSLIFLSLNPKKTGKKGR